jgi:hypothetical protein
VTNFRAKRKEFIGRLGDFDGGGRSDGLMRFELLRELNPGLARMWGQGFPKQ